MSKDYNHEIGYETLQSEWKLQCKRTPRGVTLVKSGKKILLQFKTPNTTRSKYDCACNFSIDGMYEAVRKAGLVKAKLTSLTSEVEFWEWYNKEIKEESQLVDDRITFEEAVKKVEDDFWSRPDRRKRERDKNNPSDQCSWNDTYGRFYKWFDDKNEVSISQIELKFTLAMLDKFIWTAEAEIDSLIASAKDTEEGTNKATEYFSEAFILGIFACDMMLQLIPQTKDKEKQKIAIEQITKTKKWFEDTLAKYD